MRLPFPERVPLWQSSIFAAFLCAVQQLEGTTLLFTLCTFVLIVLATIAFNIAGGFTKPTGAYVFGYSFLGAILGLIYKALMGEPAQSILLQPDRTIEVFVAGMSGMLVAVALARKFALKKSLMERFPFEQSMGRSANVCLVIGFMFFFNRFGGFEITAGGIMAILSSFNAFFPFAILLGTSACIRESGGTRSVNLTVFLACFMIFLDGIVGFSKQGIFTPLACWLIAASAQRFKVSIVQVGTILLFVVFSFYYLVPYSQYGRNLQNPEASFFDNAKLSGSLLLHLDLVRTQYLQRESEAIFDNSTTHYFEKPAGIFDRLQMIAPDDSIIDLTENGSVYGITPTIVDLENIIPHFIWKDKPEANFGNIYAHELGLLAEDDDGTGIAFTASGDAYHQAKWIGVLILLPALLFILFWVSDAMTGDLRDSPLGLLIIVSFLHVAPEGGIGGIIGSEFTGSVVFSFLIVFIAYVLPRISELFMGPPAKKFDPDILIEAKRGTFVAIRSAQSVIE